MAGKTSRRGRGALVLVRVAIVLLLCVWLLPLAVPLPSNADLLTPAELADADSRFIEIDGVSVHYKLYGSGELVFVLLHGFGASEFSWHRVVEPLATLGTVLAFDRPGFGLTGRPMPGDWHDLNPYSDDGYVALTVGLLAELGLDRVILVGHSAGGGLAVRIGLEYPRLVAGLVLVAPSVQGGGYVLSPLARCLAGSPQGRRLGPWLARALLPRLATVLDTAWHDPTAIDAETIAGYRRPLTVANWDRALWELTIAPKGDALLERLDELAMPVVYVTGDDDRIVPTASTQKAATTTPGAELVVVPQCGHLPQEEQPAAFFAAVRRVVVLVTAP